MKGSPGPKHNYTVSIDDVVRNNLKKPSFGFDFYSPPKMERLLINPRSVKMGKL